MAQNISAIINATDLLKLFGVEDLVLIDAGNGKDAKENYNQNHLEGALFVDLNTQLAAIKDDFSNGGRHPLPTIENFAETLSRLGITSKSRVVIYDDKNGSNAAARFWWMLRSAGHGNVQVLNGGFQEAVKIGFPTSSTIEIPKKTIAYEIENWKLPIATIDEVEVVSERDDFLIIDVRESARFNGEYEPIDLVAGHIPGAVTIPFSENLDSDGLFLSADVLREKYENAFGTIASDQIIFHCGSGVTACHSLLAIAYAGLEIPKLYVGSWSEWSRNNKKTSRTEQIKFKNS